AMPTPRPCERSRKRFCKTVCCWPRTPRSSPAIGDAGSAAGSGARSVAGARRGDGVVLARKFLGVGPQPFAGAGAHVAIRPSAEARHVEVDAVAWRGWQIDEAQIDNQWLDGDFVAGRLQVDEAFRDPEIRDHRRE